MDRFTVDEIADRLDVDVEVARGLVAFLVDAEFAKFRGERASERGRAKKVYSFTDGFESALAAKLRRAKLSG